MAKRISYAKARRAYRTYGRRIHAQAERAFDRKVEQCGAFEQYLAWRESLPSNVSAILTLFEIEACMDAVRSIG